MLYMYCHPQDRNPLIRALAIRTMGCIRVGEIVEYIADPLRNCLKVADPVVRWKYRADTLDA